MQTTLKIQSLPFSNVKTYLTASLFVIGNMLLPQLFHLVPQGGVTWLPIYFFTLIGAYMYGWRVGLLTAIASPLINSFIFGMPPATALPSILIKSILLAALAGYTAYRYNKVSIILLATVVLGYQFFGTLAEWAIKGDFILACQDFRIGLPGMIMQIIGGYLVINLFVRK